MKQGPFLLGLGLLTSATLALEVLDTRLLSVVTWYSLAFFVIAMGLCGLTAGAVRAYLLGDRLTEERLPEELSRAALHFAWAVPASYVAILILPLRAEPVATTVVLFLVFSAAIAIPFYPAGIAIAVAVTRTRFPVGRVYAVDLAGAALGAPLVPLLLRVLDGGSAILAMGVVAALSAYAFSRSGQGHPESARRALSTFGVLAFFTFANAATPYGLRPLWVKERPEAYAAIEAELWNSHARVELGIPLPGPAMFWGRGEKCGSPIVTQRLLIIDGHAGTALYDAQGSLENLRFVECDVTDIANLLRPGGPAAIIGVGGSRDVQAALLAHHAPVVGIELNDRILEVLRSDWGKPAMVAQHPDVRLVHDDARSYLSRSKEHFRIVQASLIDTWAATGAGAHALGENGLYTVDAWRTFLDRLEPGGLLTVSRWASVETARAVSLGVAALLDRGVASPREHIALIASGLVTTILVSRDPFTPADKAKIAEIADKLGYHVTAMPGEHTEVRGFERFLSAKSREELDRLALTDELDFRPPTDDDPFFFNVVRWRAFFQPLPEAAEGSIEGNLLATRTLGLTVFASLLFAIFTIVWPLSQRKRTNPTAPSRTLPAAFAYFALIGIGFMLVEIALLQRLSIVLGHPIYGLIVVLSTLVGSAGLGSLVSDRLPLDRAPYCYLFPALLAVTVGIFGLTWSSFSHQLIALPTAARIAWGVAVTASVGAPLGLAFPAGLRIARAIHADETPWLWGLNGVGSVMASSVAILIALNWGLSVLVMIGGACYVLLIPAVALMRRSAARTATTTPAEELSAAAE